MTRIEDRIALLIDVRAALGLDVTQALDEAESILGRAPPLAALRLRRSMAAALRGRGDTQRAAEQDAEASPLAIRLDQRLADEPEVQARFRAEFLPPRAG